MCAAIVILLSAGALLAQPQTGTIRGTVRDALSGTAIGGVRVTVGKSATLADASGGFSFRDVPAGEVSLSVAGEMARSFEPKKVTVVAGQDVTADLAVQGLAKISGVVTDSDGKPVSNALITFLTREYLLGAMRYTISHSTLTNDRGEYGPGPVVAANGSDVIMTMWPKDSLGQVREVKTVVSASSLGRGGPSIEAGRGYFLVASKGRGIPLDTRKIEADVTKRAHTPQVTWYIGARTADGAIPVTLGPGERRERVDIKMPVGPGYCILGKVRADALPRGVLNAMLLDSGIGGQGVLGYMNFSMPLEKSPDAETSLNICNLSPGDYRIASWLLNESRSGFPKEFRTQLVTITDRDVKVPLDGLPLARVAGRVEWEHPQPNRVISLTLRPINHQSLPEETLRATPDAPGAFQFDRLAADEYELQVTGLPEGTYLKDVTASGRSLLHRPIVAGGTGELGIILASDGAHLTAQVSDDDGHAVADAWVVAMPASAWSEVDIADTMVWGRTSVAGTWTSPMIAPGKYLVLGSKGPVDRSVEAVGRVFRARGRATEVELAAGGNPAVKLK
jgi:hypothetical protein